MDGNMKKGLEKSIEPKICIICEKVIEQVAGEDEFFKGGELEATFGYGSNHDQLGARGFWPEHQMDREILLTRANLLITYICDECFDQKLDFFRAFDFRETVERVPVNMTLPEPKNGKERH